VDDGRQDENEAFFLFLDKARREAEQQLSCSILHDRQISQEALIHAGRSFGSIPGIDNPNHFKIAGHLAFWIRKLKPFRIFRLSTVVAHLEKRGLSHPFPEAMLKQENPDNPNALFVNEIIAVNAAFGFICATGTLLRPKPELVQDLIVSLRYNSFSPHAVRIILEGMAETPGASP
jgi:hypothetical protein